MSKNNLILLFGIIITTTTIISLFVFNNQINTNASNDETKAINKTTLTATIIAKDNNQITIQDQKNIIYTFNESVNDLKLGNNILLEYTGLLDKNRELQDVAITDYNTIPVATDEELLATWKITAF